MRMLTAYDDDGILKTLEIDTWAAKRGYTRKYIQQRLRNGYTEDEAVNLPKRVPSKNSLRGRYKQVHDTEFTTMADKLMRKFITGGFKREQMT